MVNPSQKREGGREKEKDKKNLTKISKVIVLFKNNSFDPYVTNYLNSNTGSTNSEELTSAYHWNSLPQLIHL